ncbi:tape measure protein [Stutzerimonas stutzeri]|uniref:Tape measure protein N-terminal domain-containing protein n=1 Tax=Stutzerimonas stutzeri KOS6 TaxID=1218352 RepID=A0A061JKJ6_STUST|nr:tape measure protein [Stutzerimonas stutzeri]EWC39053.1 hypothetical protein B597_022235 [Stutzerimonas stutzeri KOS6]
MTEYARLVVAVDSTQAAKARAELEKLPGAAGRAESSANRMGASFAKLGGILASAISIREIASASEQYVNMTNRLRLVTEGSEQLAYAQEAVMRAAQQTYQPLETTAEVYQRIAQNANALGLSFAEVEAITKTVSRTIALSGADTQAAEGAMRQFGQALASGSLRGDELNSILEGTPALAQAIARGLGVSTGELRKMGADGELTAAKIVSALKSQEGAVEDMSRTMTVTAGQAMVTFRNSLVETVGKLDDTTSASRKFASAVLDLSAALDRFSSGEFMDYFRDSKQTAEGFNNEISVTLSRIRDLSNARARLDKNDPEDTVLFGFKFWNKEELDAEISGLNGQIQRFQKARDRLIEIADKPGQEAPKDGGNGTPPITPPATVTDNATKAIERQIAALRLQSETLGMSAAKAALYRLQIEGATPAQIASARTALEAVDAYERQAEAIKLANDAQEQTNRDAASILESLRTEEEAIRDSYERRRQIILSATLLTEQEKNDAIMRLKQEHDEQMIQANGSYWERYMAAAEENLGNFNMLAEGIMNNFSAQVGSAFESMVFDAESLGDAVSGLAEGMARAVVNALGQMAAQWLAYQAVQLLVGSTTQASAATTMTFNALASQQMAALNAFASTAAIPIVGPLLAPAAATAAIAATSPMVGAVASLSLAGIAHDGIDSIPREGTWLLDKGERVVDRRTNADLKEFLGSGGQGGGSGVVVNVNNAPPGTEVKSRRGSDGKQYVDVLIADLASDGRLSKALKNRYGLRDRPT